MVRIKTISCPIIAVLVLISTTPRSRAQETWTTYDMSNTPAFTIDNMYAIAINKKGDVWLGNRKTDTVSVFKYSGGVWSRELDIVGGDRIWTIKIDSRNNVWVGTAGRGVFRYDGSAWSNYRKDVDTNDTVDSLGGDWVKQIAEDASGNLWFACGPQTAPQSDDYTTARVGGLTKYDRVTGNFTRYFSNYNGLNNRGGGNCGLAENWVTAVCTDSSGNIWAGTKAQGVSKFNVSSDTWTTYTSGNGLAGNTLGPGALHFAGATRRIWAGTTNGISWTLDGSSWGRITDLDYDRIWSIESDWESNVWITHPEGSTSYPPSGLYKYDSSGTTQLGHWDMTNTGILTTDSVRRIVVDNPGGRIWCTTSRGVFVLSGNLTAKPTAPLFSISPVELSFDTVLIGESKVDSVVVANNGDATLHIASVISDNAAFTVAPAVPDSIEPSGSKKYYVTFQPAVSGAAAGNIVWQHDALGSPDSVSLTGTGKTSSDVVSMEPALPDRYSLDQNYPNPFNPATVIRYGLPCRSHVTLKVYSLLGREVATIVEGEEDAGYHEVRWEGSVYGGIQAASGVYYLRIQALPTTPSGSSFAQVRKLVILR